MKLSINDIAYNISFNRISDIIPSMSTIVTNMYKSEERIRQTRRKEKKIVQCSDFV